MARRESGLSPLTRPIDCIEVNTKEAIDKASYKEYNINKLRD